jgi:WD40 repeat protein
MESHINADICLLIAGCTDGLLLGFNLFDGRLIHCNQLHSQDIRAIHAVYPLQSAKNMNNMSYQELLWTFPSLITTSFDGTAALWRVNRNQSLTHSPKITGHFEKMAVMLGHQDKILSVCTTLTKTSSSFQRNIFTTGADGKVISWR